MVSSRCTFEARNNQIMFNLIYFYLCCKLEGVKFVKNRV
jgi:hypothetical protein